MFLLKAGFGSGSLARFVNRTLFFKTGISDRQKAVLNRKLWYVEEFRKTILFSNRVLDRYK